MLCVMAGEYATKGISAIYDGKGIDARYDREGMREEVSPLGKRTEREKRQTRWGSKPTKGSNKEASPAGGVSHRQASRQSAAGKLTSSADQSVFLFWLADPPSACQPSARLWLGLLARSACSSAGWTLSSPNQLLIYIGSGGREDVT